MNKIFPFLFIVALAAVLGFAQDYKTRQATPDEARWSAGVFDYGYNTNASQSNAYRSCRVQAVTNTSSVRITNAGITSNAFIIAFAETNASTNFVRSILASNGGFTMWLDRVLLVDEPLGIRYFIQTY